MILRYFLLILFNFLVAIFQLIPEKDLLIKSFNNYCHLIYFYYYLLVMQIKLIVVVVVVVDCVMSKGKKKHRDVKRGTHAYLDACV